MIIQPIPQEHVSDRNGEQISDVPVPQIQETGEMIQPIQQGRISDRATEQIVDVAIPEMRGQIVGVGKSTPKSVRQHTGDHVVDQIIDSPVAQIREPNVEVAKTTLEERLQQCTVEQTEDMLRLHLSGRGHSEHKVKMCVLFQAQGDLLRKIQTRLQARVFKCANQV